MTIKELIVDLCRLPEDAVVIVQTFNCPEELTNINYTEHFQEYPKAVILSDD